MEILERLKEKIKFIFVFKDVRVVSKIIFEIEDLVLGYDEVLIKLFNFYLERGKKIVLKGMNGIGKFILLKILFGIIKLFEGNVKLGDYLEVGYFE